MRKNMNMNIAKIIKVNNTQKLIAGAGKQTADFSLQAYFLLYHNLFY